MPLFATEQVLGRYPIVLEQQFAGINRAVRKLLDLAHHLESFSLLGDQHAHALVARVRMRVGLDQEQRAIAIHAVGDPGLAAVDDVMVTIALGDRADRLQVGAGIRFGEAEAAAKRT